jgi:hypothetical protein
MEDDDIHPAKAAIIGEFAEDPLLVRFELTYAAWTEFSEKTEEPPEGEHDRKVMAIRACAAEMLPTLHQARASWPEFGKRLEALHACADSIEAFWTGMKTKDGPFSRYFVDPERAASSLEEMSWGIGSTVTEGIRCVVIIATEDHRMYDIEVKPDGDRRLVDMLLAGITPFYSLFDRLHDSLTLDDHPNQEDPLVRKAIAYEHAMGDYATAWFESKDDGTT